MTTQLFKRLLGEQAAAPSHPLTRPFQCPACGSPMSLTLIAPFLTGASGDTATYTCTLCGHEETRTLVKSVD